MKPDLYTNCLLTVIAISLAVIALRPVVAVREALAQAPARCEGELKANAFGGTAAVTGGYTISLRCQ